MDLKKNIFSALIVLLATTCGISIADVKLPAIFSDNMVLQQDSNAPIWGWADAGEKIQIKLTDFPPVLTQADANGKWSAKIKTPKAGGPYEMIIQGKNLLLLRNIMLGEVWLCGGQSNMEMPIAYKAVYYTGILNWQKELMDSNYPQIRFFKVPKLTSQNLQNDCAGIWAQCAPATAADFSATAYFFGRELYKKLNVPIGLIQVAYGGTPAEAWTKRKVLESDDDFASILKNFNDACANYPQAIQEYLGKMKLWKENCQKVKVENQKLPPEPFAPMGPIYQNAPSGLYNGMINPIVSFGIKGCIWYQGESNAERPYQYRKLFAAMIKNWRDDWGQGDFPFYYVQIAPFSYKNWSRPIFPAELREAQLLDMRVPNTGMVVTLDIGDANDVHPKNKQEVGRRLSLWALAKTYGQKDIGFSGPIYKTKKIEGNKIRIEFNYTGSGLIAKGESLEGFEIAPESSRDPNYVPAKAVINGDTVVVSSDKIDNPAFVRYAWAKVPKGNLFNKDGLPASPFRTEQNRRRK